jgi:hypothetical protein
LNSDEFKNFMSKMADGNPGAFTVLRRLIIEQPVGLSVINILKCLEIKGWKIWFAFKDYCDSDINKFSELILEQDQGLIDRVNEEEKRMGKGEK